MSKPSLKDVHKDDLIFGIIDCINNAGQLIVDGEALLQLERFTRAYPLFQFSIEEIGKALMLFHLWTEHVFKDNRDLTHKINWKAYDDEFYSHNGKSKRIIDFERIAYQKLSKEGLFKNNVEVRRIVEQSISDLDKIKEYDNLKNQSLYTSIIKRKFEKPDKFITKEMTEKLKEKALQRNKLIGELMEGIFHDANQNVTFRAVDLSFKVNLTKV